MIMVHIPPEIESVYVNQKALQKMPMDWMEAILGYIKVKLIEIDNRAKLPENHNPDANARLQRQANTFMAVQFRIGEEMNRRGKTYYDMLVSKEVEEDGDSS